MMIIRLVEAALIYTFARLLITTSRSVLLLLGALVVVLRSSGRRSDESRSTRRTSRRADAELAWPDPALAWLDRVEHSLDRRAEDSGSEIGSEAHSATTGFRDIASWILARSSVTNNYR